MSTIYRYLDVLSVEKLIDNINDFIKIKCIFIIMSVMLFFYFTLHCQNKKINIMEVKTKFKIVIYANGFSHVRYSDFESELISYSDNICAVCSSFHLPVKSTLYRFDSSNGTYLRVYTRKEIF